MAGIRKPLRYVAIIGVAGIVNLSNIDAAVATPSILVPKDPRISSFKKFPFIAHNLTEFFSL